MVWSQTEKIGFEEQTITVFQSSLGEELMEYILKLKA